MTNGGVHDDRDCYARRARQEREIAARCEDKAVALIHLTFAEAYERRLVESRPRPSIVT